MLLKGPALPISQHVFCGPVASHPSLRPPSFLHCASLLNKVICDHFLKLSVSLLKSAESVPTLNSVFGNPCGTRHMGYTI